MLSRLLLFLCATATAFAAERPVGAAAAPMKPAVARVTHTFKRAGDLEIKADVHRLDDREVRPVVVWIHGGALINGGRERINRHLQQLINEGIIVVSIDYRLAPES